MPTTLPHAAAAADPMPATLPAFTFDAQIPRTPDFGEIGATYQPLQFDWLSSSTQSLPYSTDFDPASFGGVDLTMAAHLPSLDMSFGSNPPMFSTPDSRSSWSIPAPLSFADFMATFDHSPASTSSINSHIPSSQACNTSASNSLPMLSVDYTAFWDEMLRGSASEFSA